VSDDDLIPVLLTVRPSDGKISVMPLLDTPVGTAIYEGDTYTVIGQIKETKWLERNPRLGVTTTKKGWAWYYDEEEYGKEQGTATTKKAAVAAVLAAGGYREAPPNATNQGLF
jgi:hypothetical protein